jgi:hypothetical protein
MTITLTPHEIAVLTRHGIKPDELLDVTGMSLQMRDRHFKATGKRYSYKGEGCRRGGHRLYTKTHCIQCNPAAVAHNDRHRQPGFVYVAHSDASTLIKIGFCGNIQEREFTLNKTAYAGETDWRIIDYRRAQEGGAIESAIKAALNPYKADGFRTIKDTGPVECREVFWVDEDLALMALHDCYSDAQGEELS